MSESTIRSGGPRRKPLVGQSFSLGFIGMDAWKGKDLTLIVLIISAIIVVRKVRTVITSRPQLMSENVNASIDIGVKKGSYCILK